MTRKNLNPPIVKSPPYFHSKADVTNTKLPLFNNNIIENSKLFTLPYSNRFEVVPQISVLVWPHASVKLFPSTAVCWVCSSFNNGAL